MIQKQNYIFLQFNVSKVNNGVFVLSSAQYTEISIKRKKNIFLSHE